MVLRLITTCLCAMLCLLPVSANTIDSIRIWEDPEGDGYCWARIIPYVPTTIYICAHVNDPSGILGATFMIWNLPDSPGYPTGTITENWYSDFVSGDPYTEISLTWNEPQAGHWIPLGSLEFLMFDETWIQEDHLMSIWAGEQSGDLVLLDELGIPFCVCGGNFFISSAFDDSYDCGCIGCSAEPSSWSQVKSIF